MGEYGQIHANFKSICHRFKIELEGSNFQDLLIYMRKMTGSFCGTIGQVLDFLADYHPPPTSDVDAAMD
jgi:hypothetical protein